MKKYFNIIVVTLLLAATACGCKKSDSAQPKNYAVSIKDKTWSGIFTYTGKTSEYYSIHFNADNSFIWTELSGDYSGQWVVNGKQLVLKFGGSGATVKGDITDDDRLLTITASSSAYIVNSGKLVVNPNPLLDNTVWKGILTSGASHFLQLSFMTGLKVAIQIDNVMQGQFPYKRSASGGAIQVGTGGIGPFFGVITAENEMMGSSAIVATPWQATKQ